MLNHENHQSSLEGASVTRERPFYMTAVSAGFPSPADDFIEQKLDLHELLVTRPAATFFVRVSGDSMRDAGIHDGDILVIDRSITPRDGMIVIASVDREFTVKTFRCFADGSNYLYPANKKYQPIKLTESADTEIWGAVTGVVRQINLP